MATGQHDRIASGPGLHVPGPAKHPHAAAYLASALDLELAWQRLPRAHRVTINRALAAQRLRFDEWRHARRLVAWGVVQHGLTIAEALRAVHGI